MIATVLRMGLAASADEAGAYLGDDLDGADGALAPAQDQVTPVQQIFRAWDGAHIRDLPVV